MSEVWGEVVEREQIVEWLDRHVGLGEILLWDGLEDAFVGVVTNFHQETVACYDCDKIIELLMSRDGMELEEALEYIDFNIAGGYLGDKTPVLMTRMDVPLPVAE